MTRSNVDKSRRRQKFNTPSVGGLLRVTDPRSGATGSTSFSNSIKMDGVWRKFIAESVVRYRNTAVFLQDLDGSFLSRSNSERSTRGLISHVDREQISRVLVSFSQTRNGDLG